MKTWFQNLLFQILTCTATSRRKAKTPPELLQRVLRLEAKFGVARRKGRKSGGGSNAAADEGKGDDDVDVGGSNSVWVKMEGPTNEEEWDDDEEEEDSAGEEEVVA